MTVDLNVAARRMDHTWTTEPFQAVTAVRSAAPRKTLART